MPEVENLKESKLVLINKCEMCLTGVTEFLSATDNCVCVKVNNEEFVVEGKNLSVTNLDSNRGALELKGEILALSFQKIKENGKFSFKKLFNR